MLEPLLVTVALPTGFGLGPGGLVPAGAPVCCACRDFGRPQLWDRGRNAVRPALVDSNDANTTAATGIRATCI